MSFTTLNVEPGTAQFRQTYMAYYNIYPHYFINIIGTSVSC
jgi:hypothetical protein